MPRSFLEPPGDLGSEPKDDVISSVASDGPEAPFQVFFDPEIGRPVERLAGLGDDNSRWTPNIRMSLRR